MATQKKTAARMATKGKVKATANRTTFKTKGKTTKKIKTEKPKQATTPKKKFVYNTTVKKQVPTALNYIGDSVSVVIGGRRVTAERGKYLNKYGNPVYRVSVQGGARVSSTGNLQNVVSTALKKSGIDVKYKSKK